MPIELEDEIVRISNLLGRNPTLIDQEVKDLIDEYQQLVNAVIRIRDSISNMNPRVFLYPNEKRVWLDSIFKRVVQDAALLCLRERKMGEAPAFRKFVRILDSDLLAGLNLLERELETAQSKDQVKKEFEKLVMNPLLRALAELKQEIQNEKIRAELASKGLSKT